MTANRLSFESVFGSPQERTAYVVVPEVRIIRWPLWALGIIAVELALVAWRQVENSPLLELLERGLLIAAVMAACFWAERAEGKLFERLRRRAGLLRFLGIVSFGGAVLVIGISLASLAAQSTNLFGQRLFLLIIAPSLWAAGAAFGSVILLVLDGLLKTLVPDFGRRITIAILVLITLSAALCGVITVYAFAWLTGGQNATSLPTLFGSLDLTHLSIVDRWRRNPSTLVAGASLASAILALPAVLSVCTKLAYTVMERIRPLQKAFDQVAEGDRSVHVEEAGSREFFDLALSFNEMVDKLYMAERIERAFGQYVSVQVLDRIRAQQGSVHLAAELRVASVFFADIRGFTSLSERLQPAVVVGLLNHYLEQVVPVVEKHRGFLNKFIGDAVVVVFNGPIDQPDHAERATRCAIELQQEMSRLNARQFFTEVERLEIGVGVATGPMLCGNIGTQQRLEYTVIGDTVNLASRMTGHAERGEVWVSEETARRLPEDVAAYAFEPLKFKGKDRSVVPYCVWPPMSDLSEPRGRS